MQQLIMDRKLILCGQRVVLGIEGGAHKFNGQMVHPNYFVHEFKSM